MTTKELEKKLKISEKTCIHCPTLELAKQVLSIFHQLGLKWCRDNTIYYPFDGEFSSLKFAHAIGCKIISAEEFITLHTEFDLENYIPKGDLKDFPKEIIARMLDYQEEQGNERNVTVFEKWIDAGRADKGFFWGDTKEKFDFWEQVIYEKDFHLFFARYPKKQEDSQEFRIGDKVIDIIRNLKGEIINVESNGDVSTRFEGEEHFKTERRPSLLHYRDDYDYNVIDFNNLPKRQKVKRWRAKKGETYYSFTPNFEVDGFYDKRFGFNNRAYDSGNYFKTKEEAQEVADKLNKYFQELINPNK